MAGEFKKIKMLVSLAIAIAIIFGIVAYFAPKEQQKSKVIYEENITKDLPEDAVHPKEMVAINYELSIPAEDNKIIDTNNPELAKKYDIKTFAEGPFKFIAGRSGKVKGFDEAIIGMKDGETKEVIIMPSEPKTAYLMNKTKEFARNQFIPKRNVIPLKSFRRLFNKEPRINDIVFNKKFAWGLKIINISAEAAGVEAAVKQGQELSLPGLEWKSTVIYVSDKDFSVRHNPKEGQQVNTTIGPATISLVAGKIAMTYNVTPGQLILYSRDIGGISNPHLFKVTNVTDQKIIIERDDNPAEKTLKLKVTVLEHSPIASRG